MIFYVPPGPYINSQCVRDGSRKKLWVQWLRLGFRVLSLGSGFCWREKDIANILAQLCRKELRATSIGDMPHLPLRSVVRT